MSYDFDVQDIMVAFATYEDIDEIADLLQDRRSDFTVQIDLDLMLEQLEPVVRSIITLTGMGFTESEVASMLQEKPRRIRYVLKKAREKMKKMM